MTNHLLSAAQHARAAAHHAAAGGDRASYWALLATTERLAGDPELGLRYDCLSAMYEEGQLQPPS